MPLRSKLILPLQIHMSTVFLALTLISCLVIAGIFYKNSIKMVNSDADKLLKEIYHEITVEFENEMGPPAVVVDLISKHVLVEKHNLSERIAHTPFLMEAINASKELTSVYLGYPDGDFFMLRRLVTQDDRSHVGAPPDAAWALQSIDHNQTGDATSKQFIYLNNKNELLSSKEWVTEYDPRIRPWYRQSVDCIETVRSSPYIFFTDYKLGMTFARSERNRRVVVGADVRLDTLSNLIRKRQITPSSEIALFNKKGQLLAYKDTSKLVKVDTKEAQKSILGTLSEIRLPVFDKLFAIWQMGGGLDTGRLAIKSGSEEWISSVVQLQLKNGPPMFLGLVVPHSELMAEVYNTLQKTTIAAVAIIILLIPVTIILTRGIAGPLNRLAGEASRVSRFDFTESKKIHTLIKEVYELAETTEFMKKTISEFLLLIKTLNREKNFDSLLEKIGVEAQKYASSFGVCIYLLDEDENKLISSSYCDKKQCFLQSPLPNLSLDDDIPMNEAIKNKRATSFHVTKENPGMLKFLVDELNGDVTIWCIPLIDRHETSMGIIGLVYPGHPDNNPVENFEDRLAFVKQLCSLAGISLETKQLIKRQKELFNALIQLIAGSIDSKSPYTGGHCQRVPAIAKMIAQAACDAKEGPFKDFELTDEEWEELHVASWLHDCGKVTTPEFIVDKATKLETIYDRIHEVRMRFEVLSRDAEIASWKKIADGEEQDEALAELEGIRRQLTEDFALIATCNEGGEFLSDEVIERLRRIGDIEWQRTFDDRIGISWEERKRKDRTKPTNLPVTEKLLNDKEEHLFIRSERDHMPKDNKWGFKLEEPEHMYNRGELYNLEVKRGTLSNEERFRINDHIVQTIKMLKELPYPKHLKNVPEIAGGHHETTIGTGYPCNLTADQMSITAKMMVIADVFEALTASDRPYKKAKTLSEAIKIMGFMHKDGHFDPDLYDLFLSSGVPQKYGEEYLDKKQLDDIEV